MTTQQVVAFLLFVVVAAGTPGSSNTMLTAVGAQAAILRDLPSLFGQVVGMGLIMFLVPFDLGSLVLQHPLLHWALKGGGAAVLLWRSWKIATSSSGIDSQLLGNPMGFLGAAVFQWVNPKAWLVVSAAAGTFLSTRGRQPRRPGGPPCRAIRTGGSAELLSVVAVRSCRPARPAQPSQTEDLQSHHGRPTCPVDRPHCSVAAPGRRIRQRRRLL